MRRFLFIGEGKTDFIIVKNVLIGFFNDKNLFVTKLRPENSEPWGWGNLLNYLSTSDFRTSVDNTEFIVIQIDTDKCEEWNEGLQLTGNDTESLAILRNKVIEILIKRIGEEFYLANKDKFMFAISIHEIECWLLPFIADMPAHRSKIVGCLKTAEQVANKRGYSLNQKNYEAGKHYEDLSRDMKNHKELMRKYSLNPSLSLFIENLKAMFIKGSGSQPENEKDSSTEGS